MNSRILVGIPGSSFALLYSDRQNTDFVSVWSWEGELNGTVTLVPDEGRVTSPALHAIVPLDDGYVVTYGLEPPGTDHFEVEAVLQHVSEEGEPEGQVVSLGEIEAYALGGLSGLVQGTAFVADGNVHLTLIRYHDAHSWFLHIPFCPRGGHETDR